MIPDSRDEGTLGDRFLRLLHEPDPDDRPDPPAAGVAARVCVVRATPAGRPDDAPEYAVHVTRVELVDGEEEVVAGVAAPSATAGSLSAAELAAAALAADGGALRRRYAAGVEWTHVVVTDGCGTEYHRRPIAAAA